MKRIVLMTSLLLLSIGLAMPVKAEVVNFSTTGYFRDNLGNHVFQPSGWDKLTLDVANGSLVVSDVPETFSLQGLTFATGINSDIAWTTGTYNATWDMTVNGVTKTVGQKFKVGIDAYDTLYLLASPYATYFDLGQGRALKIDFLPQTLAATEGSLTGNILADINVVPIPAAIWILGSGLLSLIGFRRKFSA